MKNTKENNIQKALWHIKRHCSHIENDYSNSDITAELFHLKASAEILVRIFNDEKPYPGLDRDEVW